MSYRCRTYQFTQCASDMIRWKIRSHKILNGEVRRVYTLRNWRHSLFEEEGAGTAVLYSTRHSQLWNQWDHNQQPSQKCANVKTCLVIFRGESKKNVKNPQTGCATDFVIHIFCVALICGMCTLRPDVMPFYACTGICASRRPFSIVQHSALEAKLRTRHIILQCHFI